MANQGESSGSRPRGHPDAGPRSAPQWPQPPALSDRAEPFDALDMDPEVSYSTVNFLISTLIRPRNPWHQEQIQTRLERLVHHDMQTDAAIDEIFGDNTLKPFTVQRTPAEVGGSSHGGRVHIHVPISARHRGPWSPYGVIAKRMRAWFLRMWPELPGMFISFTKLHDSAMRNYAKKQARLRQEQLAYRLNHMFDYYSPSYNTRRF